MVAALGRRVLLVELAALENVKEVVTKSGRGQSSCAAARDGSACRYP
jgi:hypothetical protein